MKIRIALEGASKATKNKQLPIVVFLSHTYQGKRKRKQFTTPFASTSSNWNSLKNEPNTSHPQFVILLPYILGLKQAIAEIYKLKIIDIEKAYTLLGNENENHGGDIVAFGYEFAKEYNTSTKEIYETALNEFSKTHPILYYENVNYSALIKFRNKQLESVLPVTVHTYLSKIRSIYNEYCLRFNKKNEMPFKGVFKGLSTKSSKAKKNYLERKQLDKLRTSELKGEKNLARDLWMLQFYLCGQDLKDIVFMQKNDIYKNRASFRRKKMNNGDFLDVLIIPEAQEIIDRYKGEHETNLFDWRTDEKGYKTFRRNIYRGLENLQKSEKIKLPNNGKLGIKTARHTFANIGKQLFIEPDLLRELMGHERKNDVDTYYKDAYPQKVRDKFQQKIIKRAWKKKKE